jgi:hypothetical protein
LLGGPVSIVEDDTHAVWIYSIYEGTVAVALNNSAEPAALLTPWLGAELLLPTEPDIGTYGPLDG